MEKMNKKGLVLPVMFFIIIAVALAVVIIAFGFTTFLSNFKYTVLGAAIALISVWGVIKFGASDGRGKFALIFLFVGVFIALIPAFGVLQTVTGFSSDTHFEAPYFATIRCEQKGVSSTDDFAISANGEWISDKFTKNTNEWDVKLIVRENPFSISRNVVNYYICSSRNIDSSCQSSGDLYVNQGSIGQIFNLGTISSKGKYIWVQYKGSTTGINRKGIEGLDAEITYKPFVLVIEDRFRGGLQELGIEGCTIPTTEKSWINRVISYTGDAQSAIDRDLKPGEWFNYVSGTATRAKEGNLQSGGYCIYSNGQANIYQLDILTIPQGTYSIVSDKIISSPQCCNDLTYPTGEICQNGVFIKIEDKECTSNFDCGSIEWNRDLTKDNTIAKWSCKNNKCVKETEEVECASDDECENGYRCSVNTWTCVKTGTSPSGSDKDQCEDWWLYEVKVTEKDWKWYNYLTAGLIKPKESTSTECKIKPEIIFGIIALIILILGIIAIFAFRPPRQKPKFNSKRLKR